MKNLKSILATFLICFFVTACSSPNSGTTSVGNSTITVGKLTATLTSTVTIPLAAFGSTEADVETTTLAVTKNGSALSGNFDLPSHYDSSSQEVAVILSGLTAGDTLKFIFTLADESTRTYVALVSSVADSTAARTGDADGNLTVSDNGRYIYGSFSSTLVGAYVPVSGSCFREDSSDYEGFYIARDGGVTAIDFLEDTYENSTSFSNVTATSFDARIANFGSGTDYVMECSYAMSSSGVTGSCEVTEISDSSMASALGSTCDIEYVKCTALIQSEFYDSSTNEFIDDGSVRTQMDTCYEAN